MGPETQIDAVIFGQYWIKFLDTMGKYPNVFAIDIFNEPHGKDVGWGEAGKPIQYDADCEKIINAVLAKHPHIVVYVEGIQYYKGTSGQWGSMLMGAMDKPLLVPQNKLMYAPTVYGPDLYGHRYPQPQDASLFEGKGDGTLPDNFPENMDKRWDTIFGGALIKSKGIMIKEWGGHWGFRHENMKNMDPSNPEMAADALSDAKLQSHLVKYIKKHSLDSFYWSGNMATTSDIGSVWKDRGAGDLEKAKLYEADYKSTPKETTKLAAIMTIKS
jgi:aryl-phospho-beta-D-glucosidase BglC (GH1 family)